MYQRFDGTKMVEFSELTQNQPFANQELAKHASETSSSKLTIKYRVLEDGCEVGFVTLDRWNDLGILTVYDLYVLREGRGCGLGERILLEAERAAQEEGFTRVTLDATPRDPEFPAERLEAWYRRQGYRTRSDCETELEKEVWRAEGGQKHNAPAHVFSAIQPLIKSVTYPSRRPRNRRFAAPP
jgi:GNAT superfamily N-acetyltransferase